MNPIDDITGAMKQQKLENDIREIKQKIQSISNPTRLIEVTEKSLNCQKISINPHYILSVYSQPEFTLILLSDGMHLKVTESREEIMNMVNNT